MRSDIIYALTVGDFVSRPAYFWGGGGGGEKVMAIQESLK